MLLFFVLVGGLNLTAQDTINIGNRLGTFSLTKTVNTTESIYKNKYRYPNNDAYYKLTISKAMTITAYNQDGGSSGGGIEAYLHVLDASGAKISYDSSEYNNSSISLTMGSAGFFKKILPIGVYYVVVEGYKGNGNIVTKIGGEVCPIGLLPSTNIGTYTSSFNYSSTKNTTAYSNYWGQASKDVIYRFTLQTTMEVTISHCGSTLSNTYLTLINASGGQAYNNDYSGNGKCSNTSHAFLKKILFPGTYYVVSEGYGSDNNGSITTTIKGSTTLSLLRDIGTKSASFTSNNTINTISFTEENTGNASIEEVLYKVTLSKAMAITAYCRENKTDPEGGECAYIYVYDTSGKRIEYDQNEYINSGYSLYIGANAYFKKVLPMGTYYVGIKGVYGNGYIVTNISGDASLYALPYTYAGSFNGAFIYYGTENTLYKDNYYQGKTTNDVMYHFSLNRKMDVVISHCGSELSDTYLHLLNASGSVIAYNNDYSGEGKCDKTLHSYIKRTLDPGSYFVISEGYSGNGNISTTIQGTIPYLPAQPSENQNYVKTRTYTSDSGDTFRETLQYYDGLGRPVEQVQVGITPAGSDLATIREYDGAGREYKYWLPAVIPNNRGKFAGSSSAKTTYNIIGLNMEGDANPYSYIIYEPSTLNRVLEEYGPGKNWHENGKSVKTSYLTNSAADPCTYYYVSGNNLAKNGNYANNQLFVTKTTDEDNNISYEFKDKLGQVILQRQMNGNTKHDTYFVYDNFGNLRFMVPPLASDGASISTVNLNNYIYQYKYDRNRCIAKKIPGTDWVYFIYDKSGRMIFSQDGEQRKTGEWSFSIPDDLGRVVLTGTCKNSLNYAADPLKGAIVKAARTNTTNTYKGYSISNPTLVSPIVLTVNYFDNYSFMGYNGIANDANTQYETVSGYGTRYASGYKGLLTGTMTAQLNGTGNPPYLYSVMYYDYKGQLIQSKSTNHLAGGVEKEYIAYNFTGQPVKKKHIHSATGKTTQTEIYTYTYDHAGRLIQTKHKLNSNLEIVLADNTYDELGRLKLTKPNNQYILRTSYRYNIRSWLGEINNYHFRENMLYTYSGNISYIQWKQQNYSRSYNFIYDNLSRLTSAVRGLSDSENFGTSYTYDKHGNITSIYRYGRITNAANDFNCIDLLKMDYGNSNQLRNIDDLGINVLSNLSEFKDYKKGSSEEYAYNANGAMTMDLNKGISRITYNLLNLPKQIDILNPLAEAKNEYTYTATGEKLQVINRWNPNYSTVPVIGSSVNTGALILSKKIDYAGNKIYENGILTKILTENGYYENGKYYFYIRDHLGSNRVVANQTGAVEQNTHYYPFGMLLTGTGQEKQAFKFGGKELDMMNGLNLIDFIARPYDPATGRFLTPDPLAEKYPWISQYAYCGNNPISRIDPDGMDYWSTNDPEQIRAFFNALKAAEDSQFDFSSGWNHMTDSEFSDRLFYNDETKKFWINYGTVENGEFVMNARSFDANITPVSFSGEGYPGAFVYKPRSGFWGNALDIVGRFWNRSAYGIYDDGINTWGVNSSGRITGIVPLALTIGYPPAAGMKGGKFTQKMGKAKGNMPGNNQLQNKQAKSIAKELNLNKKQEQDLHRLIGGQGYNYQEALQEAKAFFNK
jgi:RHS repeat-associated protein